MESAKYRIPFSPSDWRIQRLIKKHGFEAYGVLCFLVDALYQNSGHILLDAVISNDIFPCKVNPKIITDALELGLFTLSENTKQRQFIYSSAILNDLEALQKKRASWRNYKKSLDTFQVESKSSEIGFQSHVIEQNRIEEKRIEEKRIEEDRGMQGGKEQTEIEETIEPGSQGHSKTIHETAASISGTTCEAKTRERKGALIPAIPVELFSNDNEELWRKWCSKQKKKVDADRAEFIFKKFLRQERFCNPEALNFALENAISGGWSSLFPRPPDWTQLEKVTGPDGRTYEVKSGTKRNLEKLAKLQAEEDAANEQKRNSGNFD